MNLPNKLTLTRIILVPVFMIFVSMSQYMTPDYNPRWYLIAGIIFAVASFTDYLDGHLARKCTMASSIGSPGNSRRSRIYLTSTGSPARFVIFSIGFSASGSGCPSSAVFSFVIIAFFAGFVQCGIGGT